MMKDKNSQSYWFITLKLLIAKMTDDQNSQSNYLGINAFVILNDFIKI